MNIVQSQLYGLGYKSLSKYLTEFENHRTETEEEDSALSKKSIFLFINTFFSYFYIAFVAGNFKFFSATGWCLSL